MLKPIELTCDWGTTTITPSENSTGTGPKIFISFAEPRGAPQGAQYLSAVQALALAEYLRTWALEALRA